MLRAHFEIIFLFIQGRLSTVDVDKAAEWKKRLENIVQKRGPFKKIRRGVAIENLIAEIIQYKAEQIATQAKVKA